MLSRERSLPTFAYKTRASQRKPPYSSGVELRMTVACSCNTAAEQTLKEVKVMKVEKHPLVLTVLVVALAVLSLGSAQASSARAEHRHGYVERHSAPVHRGNHGRHWQHGHHHPRVTLSIAPIYRPWVYPPYYHDPFFYRQHRDNRPIIVQQPAPQIYIEQPQALALAAPAQSQDANNYWYFCESAQAYFPYVNECPGGWQRVVPHPPAPPAR
jgi:hypothetical protein